MHLAEAVALEDPPMNFLTFICWVESSH
jgi:hypothetical protein